MKSVLFRDIASRMVSVVALCLSCNGDDYASMSATKTSTSTFEGSTSGTNSTSSGTGNSTKSEEPCSRVHEGDLYVLDDSDLEALADLGRVTGSLTIAMKEREQADLSFLSCLHTVDSTLSVSYSNRLESTGGMNKISSIRNLSIYDNASLRMIEGFDPIKKLAYLEIDRNPMLEIVDLDTLESVDTFIIGRCTGTHAAANQPALADLDGFSSLASVKWLFLEGNEALLSAGLLDSLIENGAAEPLRAVRTRFNPLLPESEVLQKLDLLGVQGTVCGNAEGDPECFCFVG